MAWPVVRLNNQTGSDTQASGAGPDPAIFGSSASTSSDGLTVDLSADNPDLTNVATDGSHVIWVSGTGGREYAQIVGKDNAAKTITVHSQTPFPANLSGKTWAIGGKRATIDGSLQLFKDPYGPWRIELEYTGIEYEHSADWQLDSTSGSGSGLEPDRHEWPVIIGVGGRPVVRAASGNWIKGRIRLENLELVGPVPGRIGRCFYGYWDDIWVKNCVIHGFQTGVQWERSTKIIVEQCEIYDCDYALYTQSNDTVFGLVFGCHIRDCTYGFSGANHNVVTIAGCIFRGCTNGLFINKSGSIHVIDSLIVESTNDGVFADVNEYWRGADRVLLKNVLIAHCGGYGINRNSSEGLFNPIIEKVGFHANTAGATNGVVNMIDPVYSPDSSKEIFVDRANGDYSLNDFGKQVFGDIGIPQTWPGLPNTTSYPDIGAVESQAGSGGGGASGVPLARVFAGM